MEVCCAEKFERKKKKRQRKIAEKWGKCGAVFLGGPRLGFSSWGFGKWGGWTHHGGKKQKKKMATEKRLIDC